ncbi:hypothetical protein AMTRI_Chr02g260410 [Amborella trichopoda]
MTCIRSRAMSGPNLACAEQSDSVYEQPPPPLCLLYPFCCCHSNLRPSPFESSCCSPLSLQLPSASNQTPSFPTSQPTTIVLHPAAPYLCHQFLPPPPHSAATIFTAARQPPPCVLNHHPATPSPSLYPLLPLNLSSCNLPLSHSPHCAFSL